MATKNHEGEWIIPDDSAEGDRSRPDFGPDPERLARMTEITQLAAAGELDAPAGAEEIVEALAHAARERDEMFTKLQRALADYQNFQRRARLNEREARESGTRSVVERALTILDHFELALGLDPAKASAEQVIGGVRVIRDELLRVLSGFGVAVIEPSPGDEFNPTQHEAMLRMPTAEHPEGTIAQIMSVGYMLNERVVRPAKVGVAAPPAADETEA